MRNSRNRRDLGQRSRLRFRSCFEALDERIVPAVLPDGFIAETIAFDLISATKIAVAADDTVFVGFQGGEIYRVGDDGLGSVPVAVVNARAFVDQGLIGMVIDPAYPAAPYAYVLANQSDGQLRNRLIRITLDGTNQETTLVEFDQLVPNANAVHAGGGMAFGPDGKLYVSIGDQDFPERVQDPRSHFGKVLRIETNGAVPIDNPTPGSYVYARGFRNPFDMDVDPVSGQIFVNDVGLNRFEEINRLVVGGNYGWPGREGTGRGYLPTRVANPVDPWFAYAHGDDPSNSGCAITGGTFTTGMAGLWPAAFANAYFYADFCHDQIRMVDLETRSSRIFASGLAPYPVDMAVNSKGELFYLGRGDESDSRSIVKISYAPDQPPQILADPASVVVPIGGEALFEVKSAGAGPISYEWFVAGQRVESATGPVLKLGGVGLEQSGSTVEVRLTNPHGTVMSRPSQLRVVDDLPPTIAIRRLGRPTPLGPRATLRLALDVRSAQGEVLDPSQYRWKVDLGHNTHTHMIVPMSPGQPQISFRLAPHDVVPGETLSYRVTVEANVSSGLKSTFVMEILPTVRNRRIAGWRIGQVHQMH